MLCRPITSILLVVLGCGVASATRDWGSWKDWTSSTSAFNRTNNSTGPSFCHGYPCPSFTTEGNSTVYEIRTYPATTWVTRCENDSNFHYAMAKGRLPLYGYMHGSNKQGRSLPSSAPLAVRITPNASLSGAANSTWTLTKNFTLAMYLANETTTTAPEPESSATHLTTFDEGASISERRAPDISLPAGLVYVLQFGGYATTSAIVDNARKLAAALAADGLTFDNSSFIYAQYDTPARIRHRHNEIWFTECGHDDAFIMTA